jgi:argininosuccinate lyase
MLNKIGILSKTESNKLIMCLYEIIKLDDNDAFIIKQEDEDSHTAIENYLIKKLGDFGKKIHIARSRNDQVLTALRLHYKDELKAVIKLINKFIETLTNFKAKYDSIEIPGYTHMQKAMPSSVGMWTDAFIESMDDNKILIQDIYNLIDQSPLGTGAGYGLPIEIDREMTAKCLGFKKIQKNPIYVQNSRGKFESTILHGLSQIMFDLNKMTSDLLLFSMTEFKFFILPNEYCTGSSIMPHKKNPDVLELVRAKYNQIVTYEFEVKSIIANLISGYNRDLQLTKKPVINGFEISKDSIKIMNKVLENLTVDKDKCINAMTKELYSADKVYNITQKGVPFREAYKKISQDYWTKRNV